jgi:heat shock protein HslJ
MISADGKASGFAGVNRFFCSVSFGNAIAPPIPITFGPVAATRMAGPPGRMELERAFTSMLAHVRSAEVTAGEVREGHAGSGIAENAATLLLRSEVGVIARFRPAPAEPAPAR